MFTFCKKKDLLVGWQLSRKPVVTIRSRTKTFFREVGYPYLPTTMSHHYDYDSHLNLKEAFLVKKTFLLVHLAAKLYVCFFFESVQLFARFHMYSPYSPNVRSPIRAYWSPTFRERAVVSSFSYIFSVLSKTKQRQMYPSAMYWEWRHTTCFW